MEGIGELWGLSGLGGDRDKDTSQGGRNEPCRESGGRVQREHRESEASCHREREVGSSRSGEELDFLSMCERKASEAVSLKCGFFSTSLNIDI